MHARLWNFSIGKFDYKINLIFLIEAQTGKSIGFPIQQNRALYRNFHHLIITMRGFDYHAAPGSALIHPISSEMCILNKNIKKKLEEPHKFLIRTAESLVFVQSNRNGNIRAGCSQLLQLKFGRHVKSSKKSWTIQVRVVRYAGNNDFLFQLT